MHKESKKSKIIIGILLSIILVLAVLFSVVVAQANHVEYEEEQFTSEPHDRVAQAEETNQVSNTVQQVEPIPIPKKINDGYTQTLTKSMGAYYYNGKRETYYSSRVLYHYRTPEWIADDNGFYHDADGYFVVASSEISQGSVIQISMGLAKIYDAGCEPGTIDIYVNW